MKLKQIKTEAELYDAIYSDRGPDTPPRSFCEITSVDGVVKAARIGAAHFRMEAYGTVGIFREVEHEEAERYRIVAKTPGFPPQVTYHETITELREKQRSYGDAVETNDNSSVQVKVLVDDNGNVVREVYLGEPIAAPPAPPAASRSPADEIQF